MNKIYVHIPTQNFSSEEIINLENLIGTYIEACFEDSLPYLPENFDRILEETEKEKADREKLMCDCNQLWICFAVGTDEQDEYTVKLIQTAYRNRIKVHIMPLSEINALIQIAGGEL